jgi:Mrp family chromosome partitioning ATPase
LAAAALLEGRDPLLVDGDLRLRRLSKMAGADGELGLVDLADGPEEFYQRTVRRLPVFQDALRLRLLPAGSTADMGAGSIRRPGVARFFRALSESGELTIVDSAPVLATADTTVLGSQVDAVVLVVREGTSREILAAVADRLRFVGSPVLGFVYVSTRDAATGRTGLYEYKTDRYVQAIAAADPVRSADEFEVSLPGLIEDEDEGGEAGADRAGGTAAGREPLGPQRPADSTLPSTEPTRPSS